MPIKNKKESINSENEHQIEKRDGRYLLRTNRTVQLATRVTPEFDKNIRHLAHQNKCLLVEMLERYEQAYLKQEAKKDQVKQKKSTDSKR